MSEVGTTPKLTRTRSVLTLIEKTGYGAQFASEVLRVEGGGIDTDDTRPYVTIPPELWNDLGKPEHITIAIYPGDRQDIIAAEDFPE